MLDSRLAQLVHGPSANGLSPQIIGVAVAGAVAIAGAFIYLLLVVDGEALGRP